MQDLVGDAITVFVDSGAATIEAFGLREIDQDSQKVVARPSVFIVDSQRTIRYRYIGRTIEDRPKIALLMLGVESLGEP